MAKLGTQPKRMTKSKAKASPGGKIGNEPVQQDDSEVERLRHRIRRLESDLTASVTDRATSLVELSNALFEERGRVSALAAEMGDMTNREAALEQARSALQRDRELLAAEMARAVNGQRFIEAPDVAQGSPKRVEDGLVDQSDLAWRLVRYLQDLARRHPRMARFAARVLRVLWWAANGQLKQRFRAWRARRGASRLEMAERVLPAHEKASRAAAVPDVGAARSSFDGTAQTGRPASGPAATQAKPSTRRAVVVLPVSGHRPAPEFAVDGERDDPLVSVIVTSFNYGRSIERAVDSVLAQTFKNLEVIVVEGGSPDPHSRLTVARLDRPRTRVLMQGDAHRAGGNRNYGISQARGKYICCLDADDALAPTYVEKAVFLLERQDYDVVGCALKLVGDDHGTIPILDKPDLGVLLDSNNVLTCAIFRKSYWDASGGYRDVDKSETGHVHEDWAFWVRLAALGARFYNLHHDPLLFYTVHRSSLSRGANVLPMWQQRQIIREMNRDVLGATDQLVAFSARRKAWTKATPALPPLPIEIEPEPSRRPPTVLLALPFMLLGGAERLLREVVGDLVKRGWRVVIVASTPAPADAGDTTHWFLEHTKEVFKLTDGMPASVWEEFLHHLVRSRGVDVLWIVGSALAYDSVRGLRAARPTMRVADLLFNTIGHTANNRRRSGSIDVNFVESSEVRDWLLAHGETPDRIRLIKSGVDTKALAPRSRSEALSERIGASPDDLIVGFCGRWSEEKNPLGFIAQAQRVDPRSKVRFVMTGTGPMRLQIESALRQADFPKGKFHLLGEVDDIAAVLGSLDLLVVPSTLDGRPVVVLEALSLGVPVLASNVGALPELVSDGRTGWICEPGDDAAFAWRIEEAAKNREGLAGMRHRARAFSEAHLDILSMLGAYHDGLSALLPDDRRNAR